jgi:hypothetical protein
MKWGTMLGHSGIHNMYGNREQHMWVFEIQGAALGRMGVPYCCKISQIFLTSVSNIFSRELFFIYAFG